MTTFNLTINENNKIYNNLNDAKAVLNRALRIAKANQKKYDGVQVLDYMSIDELENGEIKNYDLVYVCGSKI
jgi:hypothetical protein